MDSTPRTASSCWHDLQQSLGDSFAARVRGLLATDFDLLDPEGREFGRLRLRGPSAAGFEFGDHAASLERMGDGYRMVADGEEVLTAVPERRSIDELEVSCGGRIYEARISFFRNHAVASYRRGGGNAVRVSGGLAGRRYRALFARDDGYALPIAVFLLWHVAANRRRAYRMGNPTGGGAM